MSKPEMLRIQTVIFENYFLSDMKGGFLSIIVYSLKLYKTQDMFDNSLCLSHNQ